MIYEINQDQTSRWQLGKEGIKEAQAKPEEIKVTGTRREDDPAQAQNFRPKYDEYIPEDRESNESPGLYHLDTDDAGNQKIEFTPPYAAETPKTEETWAREADGDNEEGSADNSSQTTVTPKRKKPPTYSMTSHGDTSKVKAEIAGIKEKRAEISQQLQKAGDDEQRKSLEAQLAQLDAELAMKDNPEYIKRNAKRTDGPVVEES